MSPLTGVILIFSAIIISIILSSKTKVNLGIYAMLFAFLIGFWGYGLSTNDIWSTFPSMLVITFILAMTMFGFVNRANIFQKLSGWILYGFRKHPALMPYAIALSSTVIIMLGGNYAATMAIMGPIAYSMALQLGFPTILAGVSLWAGIAAGNWPWTSTSALNRMLITDLVGPQYCEPGLYFVSATIFMMKYVIITIVYLICKGYKIKGTDIEIKKPEPFTKEEKKVGLLLIFFVIFASVPPVTNMIFPNPVSAWLEANVNLYVLFVIGIIILAAVLKIEKLPVVLKEDVSWELILMITGMTFLIKLLPKIGGIDLISSWITKSNSSAFILPILFLCGAIMTLFTSGTVAANTLYPMIAGVLMAFPGLSHIGTYCAMWIGTSGPTISPFSTGGALTLMTCPDEYKEKQTKQQIYVAGLALLVGFIISISGWCTLIKP